MHTCLNQSWKWVISHHCLPFHLITCMLKLTLFYSKLSCKLVLAQPLLHWGELLICNVIKFWSNHIALFIHFQIRQKLSHRLERTFWKCWNIWKMKSLKNSSGTWRTVTSVQASRASQAVDWRRQTCWTWWIWCYRPTTNSLWRWLIFKKIKRNDLVQMSH